MSVVLLVQVVRVHQGCTSKQFKNHSFPGVAQLVARLLWEQEVARSNRVARTTWEYSSAGRALALQARGHRFEPCCSHHAKLCRTLSGIKASHIGCVKSNLWGCSSGGRAPALQAGCREFEPLHLHQYGTIKLGRKGTAFTARQCLHWKLVMRWFGGTPSPERTSKVKTES